MGLFYGMEFCFLQTGRPDGALLFEKVKYVAPIELYVYKHLMFYYDFIPAGQC